MRPSGSPEPVSTHDFPDAALGKVIPYGIYDLAADTGWVNVGCDHDDQLAAVPLARHDWHGNYTIHPAPEHTAVADSPTAGTAAHPARPDLTWLRAPALTGLTPPQWDTLIEKLTVTRHAQREAQLHQRCGGARQAAPGTGRKAVLSLDDRLAITLLHLRFATRQRTLAELFAVTQQTIHKTIKHTRPLLDLAGHPAHPTGITLADARAVNEFASSTIEHS